MRTFFILGFLLGAAAAVVASYDQASRSVSRLLANAESKQYLREIYNPPN